MLIADDYGLYQKAVVVVVVVIVTLAPAAKQCSTAAVRRVVFLMSACPYALDGN